MTEIAIWQDGIWEKPKALRFDVNEVDITKDGDNLIIKPVKQKQSSVVDAFVALI
jgi:virulence-associated protein VagC